MTRTMNFKDWQAQAKPPRKPRKFRKNRPPRVPADAACQHCGRRNHIRPVRVDPLRPGVPDVVWLFLCDECRDKPNRTWRMRYREVAA
jgi:hypothetical protein